MLSPSFRLINPQADRSFVFKWDPLDLTMRWHYHPEIELIYFVKGKTTAVMGDGFHQFEAGDLVLLGANFPHVLQEHSEYAREHANEEPFGVTIQFTEDFLGKDFLRKPELFPIQTLIKKAHRGLRFSQQTTSMVASMLDGMHELNETKRLLTLLNILNELSSSTDHAHLAPEDYSYDYSQDEDRMRSINEYVYQHFREAISIAQIAAAANMTETSFCRYFKTRTAKTFTHFLNEVRIAYACRLLNNSRYSVSEACFESGFNNHSYFNRQFKLIMKMSPKEYQQWKKKAVRLMC